jgi:hypothetical protein
LLAITAVSAGSTAGGEAAMLVTVARAMAKSEMTWRIAISSKCGRGILRDYQLAMALAPIASALQSVTGCGATLPAVLCGCEVQLRSCHCELMHRSGTI